MRRIISLIICLAILSSLAGCYSLPAETASEVPNKSATVSQDTQNGYCTYEVPQENLAATAVGSYAPAFSVDGLYRVTTNSFEIHDISTGSVFSPCYQMGCSHSDNTCPFYFGRISSFAEYHRKYYAMVVDVENAVYHLTCCDVAGGTMQEICRWEADGKEKQIICGINRIDHNAAYVSEITFYYSMDEETGIMSLSGCDTTFWRVDLATGLGEVIIPNESELLMQGVWNGRGLFVRECVNEDAITYEEYEQMVANEGYVGEYADLIYQRTLFLLDFGTGEQVEIASTDTGFSGIPVLNSTWGQYGLYKCGDQLSVIDMETEATEAVFSHRNIINYWIMDGRAFALVSENGACRIFATELSTGNTIEVDNCGMEAMYFSIYGESNDMFYGYCEGAQRLITKQDFYNGNYSTSFQ